MTPDDLPAIIPIFPLPGILLLPGGQLPLHIFEPRYVAMTEDALAGNRLIGMIQPDAEGIALQAIGCVGHITQSRETGDGRYIILLEGIARFRVRHELPPIRGYRKIEADWIEEPTTPVVLDRGRLMPALKRYLSSCCPDSDWQAIAASRDEKLATCLAMICPLSPTEQQALLEADCGQQRADMLTNLIEIASHGPCGTTH